MKLKSRHVLCPVCAAAREIPSLEIPWSTVIGWSLMWSVLLGAISGLSYGFWPALWTFLLSGLLCFLGFEVYYSLNHKRELVCPVCHFDPVLYRRSPEKAKERCLKALEGKQKHFMQKWKALKDRRFAQEFE